MNKKLLSVLLALSVMTGAAALADGYTAGTYTGRADGRNGEITVDVTFSEDAITDIVVKDHQETAGIADAAINDLPGRDCRQPEPRGGRQERRDLHVRRHCECRGGRCGAGRRRRGRAARGSG